MNKVTHKKAEYLLQAIKDVEELICVLQDSVVEDRLNLQMRCPHKHFILHTYRPSRDGSQYSVKCCSLCHAQFDKKKIK